MRTRWVAVLAVAAMVAACEKKEADENVTSDSTAIGGGDTVVQTTTTEVDTIQNDSTNKDTTTHQ
jgi:hypothetical protein